MPTLYQFFLILHIAAGSLSLFTGSLNMILPKGGKRHQKIGRVFVAGMMLTGGSALFMAQIKPNPFLFIIGVFTIYLVGTADRYIKLTHIGRMVGGFTATVTAVLVVNAHTSL